MIKFFRSIRKNLLEKGKTGKYFKYAIGEILLVMVGILIALQVNNWNQRRIDANSYNILLNGLIIDLENDVKELTNLITVSKNQNEIILKILNNFKFTNKSLTSIVRDLCFSPESFTPNTSSFDILINYGSFDLLKLKEVSTEIQSLYNSAMKINQESYIDRNKLISENIRPQIMTSGAVSIGLNNKIKIDKKALLKLFRNNKKLRGHLIELQMINDILNSKRLSPLNNKFKSIANGLKTKSKDYRFY